MFDVKHKNYLPLNLQLFAEGEEEEGSEETKETEEPQVKEHMIPKTRFDSINNELKTTKKQLDELLTKLKAEEDAQAAKRGEFESLYQTTKQELDSFKAKTETGSARINELEAVINELVSVRLQSIPEELQELIPGNLTPEQKLSWIEKANSKGLFGKSKNPEQPVGGSTNPSTEVTKKTPQMLLQEAAEVARKSGRIEDKVTYAKLKRELGL